MRAAGGVTATRLQAAPGKFWIRILAGSLCLKPPQSACETKAADWAERKRLRSEEIASINEAISVLRSDDARDTFKKSFDSQSFIQLEKKHDHRRKLGLVIWTNLSAPGWIAPVE